jgi:hypothetical protein
MPAGICSSHASSFSSTWEYLIVGEETKGKDELAEGPQDGNSRGSAGYRRKYRPRFWVASRTSPPQDPSFSPMLAATTSM